MKNRSTSSNDGQDAKISVLPDERFSKADRRQNFDEAARYEIEGLDCANRSSDKNKLAGRQRRPNSTGSDYSGKNTE